MKIFKIHTKGPCTKVHIHCFTSTLDCAKYWKFQTCTIAVQNERGNVDRFRDGRRKLLFYLTNFESNTIVLNNYLKAKCFTVMIVTQFVTHRKPLLTIDEWRDDKRRGISVKSAILILLRLGAQIHGIHRFISFFFSYEQK